MTFLTRLNKNCAALPLQTSAPQILSFVPCNPMHGASSCILQEEQQSCGFFLRPHSSQSWALNAAELWVQWLQLELQPQSAMNQNISWLSSVIPCKALARYKPVDNGARSIPPSSVLLCQRSSMKRWDHLGLVPCWKTLTVLESAHRLAFHTKVTRGPASVFDCLPLHLLRFPLCLL